MYALHESSKLCRCSQMCKPLRLGHKFVKYSSVFCEFRELCKRVNCCGVLNSQTCNDMLVDAFMSFPNCANVAERVNRCGAFGW